MLIACIQELSHQTSRQDLRNVAMSQWFRPLLRPVRADQSEENFYIKACKRFLVDTHIKIRNLKMSIKWDL